MDMASFCCCAFPHWTEMTTTPPATSQSTLPSTTLQPSSPGTDIGSSDPRPGPIVGAIAGGYTCHHPCGYRSHLPLAAPQEKEKAAEKKDVLCREVMRKSPSNAKTWWDISQRSSLPVNVIFTNLWCCFIFSIFGGKWFYRNFKDT